MLNALLVAIVYYLSMWVSTMAGVFHLNRPIVVGPLVGLVLGDLQTGIILGATFETVFLGVIAVGGAVPADATIGAIMGTAIAITSGADSETALAIAVPVSLFGVLLGQVTNAYLPLFIPKMDSLAATGEEKKLVRYNFLMSVLFPLFNTIAVFLAVWLGTNAVEGILESIPQFITNGFTAAGTMLPAVGFALLLNMLFDKKVFIYFFLGFAIAIYLELPSLAIAIFAMVIAITQFINRTQFMNGHTMATDNGVRTDEEAFFDE